MGCNMHMFVEMLRGGRWVHIPDAFVSWSDHPDYVGPDVRSYALYGRLAGVRSAVGDDGLFPSRGLPADLDDTDWMRDDAWWCDRVDLHSISWATFDELLAADWSYATNTHFVEWLRGPGVARLVEQAGVAMRLRLVFGFDN